MFPKQILINSSLYDIRKSNKKSNDNIAERFCLNGYKQNGYYKVIVSLKIIIIFYNYSCNNDFIIHNKINAIVNELLNDLTHSGI